MSNEFAKVEALLALGRTDEATSLVDRLPARDQPTPEYLRLRGRALRASGRVFDAEASFREALELAPQDPGLLIDLATTLLGQRRLKEARAYAREAVAIRPDVAAWHCLVGVLADELGYASEAGEALGLARALAPQDAEAHVVFGWHALRQGQLDASEEAFRAALAIAPGRAEALRGLARARAAGRDWEGARSLWLEALAIDPVQRDRVLARAMVLGNPSFRPLLRLTAIPLPASLVAAAAGIAALAASGGRPGPAALAVPLLAFAAAGPLARAAIRGSLRE